MSNEPWVWFHLFGHRVHPHLVMELIAYTGGMQCYLWLRRRWPRATVPLEQNLWIIVGCVFGALVGSKLLAWAESWQVYARALAEHDPAALGGKSIVGGLLGGWAGVELVKKRFGITRSTGDAFVFPLILGMCVGRVGCFLTGLPDKTYGNFTHLPWGVDFGDGPRHPTQLYEIAFLLLLGLLLLLRMRRPYPNGHLFRLFLFSYLCFRLAVEFIKPVDRTPLGLSAIQLASLVGAIACAVSLVRTSRRAEPITEGRDPMTTPGWEPRMLGGSDDDALRAEAWAGELRVNLIRLLAIALLYGRHLAEFFLAPAGSPVRGAYHAQVTVIVFIWALAAALVHLLLIRRAEVARLRYAVIAMDVAMITAVCAMAGGPKTTLIVLYFVLVATAPLRLSLRVVYAAAAAAIAGYLLLLAHYAWYVVGFKTYYATPALRIPRSEEAIVVLSLLVSGLLAGQAVRQALRLVHGSGQAIADNTMRQAGAADSSLAPGAVAPPEVG